MEKNAQYWRKQLGLEPHPEGGYYRRTYQSAESITDRELLVTFDGKRFLATCIHFLLPSGEVSHFHRLKSDEVWYYHAGSSLTVHVIHEDGVLEEVRLGTNVEKGEVLQFAVPKNSIFGSSVNEPDSYALVSCMVTPGFDFADFELFEREELLALYPEHRDVIVKLTMESVKK